MGLFIVLTGVGNPGWLKYDVALEIILSQVPFIGLVLSLLKLLWRSKFYTEAGLVSDSTSDPFNMKGCLPEIIGMGFSIVLWPLLTLLRVKVLNRQPSVETERAKKVQMFNGIENQAV